MSGKQKYAWDELGSTDAQKAFDTWDRNSPPGLAAALGSFFIAWGQLELSVQAFLREVCKSTRPDHYLALGGQLDLYQKTRALVALTNAEAPSQEWREVMRDTGGFITGKLREYRNRMAHDFWIQQDEVISSLEFRPEVDKKLNEVRLAKERVRTPEEINQATWQVAACSLQVKHLRDRYIGPSPENVSPIWEIPRISQPS